MQKPSTKSKKPTPKTTKNAGLAPAAPKRKVASAAKRSPASLRAPKIKKLDGQIELLEGMVKQLKAKKARLQ